MARPVSTRRSSPPKEATLDIDRFAGINLSTNANQINKIESPDMLNILSDDQGALDKVLGTIALFFDISSNPVNCLLRFEGSSIEYIFAVGTTLYSLDLDTGVYTSLGTVTNHIIRGFNYNNNLYILDGTDYKVYDGATLEDVVGYIPTITIGTPPTGGGTAFEDLNLISSGFIQQFNGNGTATVYTLLFDDLDSDTVLITVDGGTLIEDTDFTVVRATGIVTFNDTPSNGTNNVIITAFKEDAGIKTVDSADDIKKCTVWHIWGGTTGTRIFLTGNSDKKNFDFSSGLQDPTYFPVTGFDQIGDNTFAVVGYSSLYSRQIILTEQSIYSRVEDFNDSGFFTAKSLLNDSIGCISVDSIQIIEDFPTFLTTKGIYQVVSVDTQNENNIRHISTNVDRNNGDRNSLAITGILEQDNLENTISIDFDEKYWLIFTDIGLAYIFDYRYKDSGKGQWFRIDNLLSTSIVVFNNKLYFGHSTDGYVYRWKDNNETISSYIRFTDAETTESTAVLSQWSSKIFDYNTFTNLKLIRAIFETLKPAANGLAFVYYRTDTKPNWILAQTLPISVNIFAFSTIEFSTFLFSGSLFPTPFRQKAKVKKVAFFQLKLENNELNATMGIQSVSFRYSQQREVKKS